MYDPNYAVVACAAFVVALMVVGFVGVLAWLAVRQAHVDEELARIQTALRRIEDRLPVVAPLPDPLPEWSMPRE